MKLILTFIAAAVFSYFLGCINGAILMSRSVFHEDIREKGSGNAGLTNFYRIYGVKGMLPVIGIDMLKMVIAVALSKVLFAHALQMPLVGAYWAGLWVILGHCYPCMFAFRGGKGILTASALLIMLDWRIAVIGFAAFFLGVLLTGYVSLGSILAIVSFPVTTVWVFLDSPNFAMILALSLLAAATTLWSHRSNIKRLISGNENKFHVHKEENR